MFKVAVAGSGYIAQNHFGALKKIEDVEITAVIGRNPETCGKVAAEYGCKWVKTLKEARDLGADVVDICLPTDLHEQWVV